MAEFGLFHALGYPAGSGGRPAPRNAATGGHVAAVLSASRGQRAAPRHALERFTVGLPTVVRLFWVPGVGTPTPAHRKTGVGVPTPGTL